MAHSAERDAVVAGISERLEEYLSTLPWWGKSRAEAMVDVRLDDLIADLRDVVHPRPRTPRTRDLSPESSDSR